MTLIVLSDDAIDTVVSLISINSMVSIWWDGVKKLPYMMIDQDNDFSVDYNGTFITNYGIQNCVLPRPEFTHGYIVSKDTQVSFTPLYDSDIYRNYAVCHNGCSIRINKLIVVRVSDTSGLYITCSFHLYSYLGVRRLLFDYEYTVF